MYLRAQCLGDLSWVGVPERTDLTVSISWLSVPPTFHKETFQIMSIIGTFPVTFSIQIFVALRKIILCLFM